MSILAGAEQVPASSGVRGAGRRFRRAVPLAVMLGSACNGTTPNKPPEKIPQVRVVGKGDGEAVAGYFGMEGGVLMLGPQGPSVFIASDSARKDGVSLGLRKDTGPVLPTGASSLGVAFRSTAVFEPPSNVFVEVWSSELQQLPAPCTPDNLELAVQEPQQVGPSDGTSSPALAWKYERADWAKPHVKARLPKLSPQPMQFVCARNAAGGT
jgi:hypothetical protein